jgi:HK97 family phage prohead protease
MKLDEIRVKSHAERIKAADGDSREFEGYVSVFGNIDSYGEKVMPGAFANSLARHKREGTMPLLLWQHNSDDPIGVWDDLSDDGKGLYGKGHLLTGVQSAEEAYVRLKAGAVWGLSIGYREVDVTPADGGEARLLNDLDLIEASIVSFPANRRAGVDTVKAEGADLDRVNKWTRLEDFMRKLRDGEPLPVKEFEDLLREAGAPKAMAVQIASVGYAKAIRSESEGDQANPAMALLRDAAKAFTRT